MVSITDIYDFVNIVELIILFALLFFFSFTYGREKTWNKILLICSMGALSLIDLFQFHIEVQFFNKINGLHGLRMFLPIIWFLFALFVMFGTGKDSD